MLFPRTIKTDNLGVSRTLNHGRLLRQHFWRQNSEAKYSLQSLRAVPPLQVQVPAPAPCQVLAVHRARVMEDQGIKPNAPHRKYRKLVDQVILKTIALFTVTFAHLHDNVFERGREAISGKNFRIARNCLTSTFKHIVMQMRKGNCEKGYWTKRTGLESQC